jgi:YD repeat-containing protein
LVAKNRQAEVISRKPYYMWPVETICIVIPWRVGYFFCNAQIVPVPCSIVALIYTYDALNRRVSETTTRYAFPFQLTLSYDALSRRSSVVDNWNAKTNYAYDAEGRLTSLTTPWGGVITQSYDFAGRPSRLAYPNGLDADLSFETATGRLASITHHAGSQATPIAQFTHGYDIRGNLATLTELNGSKSFAYDAVERLTGVTQSALGAKTQVESYSYDPDSNRTDALLKPGAGGFGRRRLSDTFLLRSAARNSWRIVDNDPNIGNFDRNTKG